MIWALSKLVNDYLVAGGLGDEAIDHCLTVSSSAIMLQGKKKGKVNVDSIRKNAAAK